ncbi:hypothetical protein F4778DRAFT_714724 [Xylariomycetidae sp. FL2044]|nr:hypothetical protein F4778DRAFT_714724 [Xylariomycetidae sp. FL2044]
MSCHCRSTLEGAIDERADIDIFNVVSASQPASPALFGPLSLLCNAMAQHHHDGIPACDTRFPMCKDPSSRPVLLAYLESYEDPPQPFLHIFLPVLGPKPQDREAAIQETAVRLRLWPVEDPSSHWQKVVDTETGRIVGGASWNIYMTNPFIDSHPSDVTWFPDNSSRKGRPLHILADEETNWG